MSEWDFLWGLKGEELEDAIASGMSQSERDSLNEHRIAVKAEWESLKLLRDSGSITMEEFRKRKKLLFPINNQK